MSIPVTLKLSNQFGALGNMVKQLEQAGADWQMNIYGGAKHSFTNPDADRFGKEFGLPLAYSKSADKASWKDLEAFLENAPPPTAAATRRARAAARARPRCG